MKIGVISDTHIPDMSPVLSARIEDAFKGLDIILHLGDISELYVLEEFQETYTLTFAVSGERDGPKVKRYLDEKRIVRFGERRVGMIHGHQFEMAQQGAKSWMQRLFGRTSEPGTLIEFLLEQFVEDDVHAIVCGHTHEPYIGTHGGVLLFNPGAAVPMPGHRPSIGILNVEKEGIEGSIVYL